MLPPDTILQVQRRCRCILGLGPAKAIVFFPYTRMIVGSAETKCGDRSGYASLVFRLSSGFLEKDALPGLSQPTGYW